MENYYGMAFGRWFDGEIDTVPLYDPWDVGSEETGVYSFVYSLNINEVIKHINQDCSQDTFYECLFKKFTSAYFCNESHSQQNLNGSPSYIEWSPFLNIDPSSPHIEASWLKYVQDLLKSDVEIPCKISCVVKEFKTRLIKREPLGLVKRDEMRLEYKFEMPFNEDLRSTSPYKMVKKEYHIMPLISLNNVPCCGLLKKSAHMLPVGQSTMAISPWSTWSLTKKYLFLMCFVLLVLENFPFVSNNCDALLSCAILDTFTG